MNKKLLTMGLAALLMAGCSSDDIVGGEGDNGGASAVQGYVGLTITMPTSAGSRAGTYDDGLSAEYKVNDVTLVFSEYDDVSGTHKIKQVTKFTSTDWNDVDPEDDDITSASVLPVVPMVDKNAKSVLVLVNSSSIFSVVSSTFDSNTGGNSVVTGSEGSIALATTPLVKFNTIEDLEKAQEIALEKYNGAATGFFMANASIKNGSNIDADDDHNQLVMITPEKSKEAAMQAAKNNVIYVERAVAKVSLRFNSSDVAEASKEFTFSGTGFTSDKITFDGWGLDVTNKWTYPLRRISATWPDLDRFAPSAGTPQRYEWSEDYNYNSFDAGHFNRIDEAAVGANTCNASLYCFENTFNLDNMKQNRTTRAVLRGQIHPDGIDDYSTNGVFRLGESVTFYSKANMLGKIKDAAIAAGVTTAASADVEQLKVGKNDFSFTDGADNEIVIKDASSNPISLNSDQQAAIKVMLGQLTYYQNGYCYYPVRIRHFADDTDPYNNGVSAWNAGNTYDTDAKWLGRYGVVRNNSYVINVTGVSAPGTPTVPGLTENIDDEEFYYIQATVKVLSWTKRTQNVEL